MGAARSTLMNDRQQSYFLRLFPCEKICSRMNLSKRSKKSSHEFSWIYPPLSTIRLFALNFLNGREISYLFCTAAPPLVAFSKQSSVNIAYLRFCGQWLIQVGTSHEIDRARFFISRWSTGQIGLNFPSWISHEETLLKAISVGFSVFCPNGQVTVCHHEKSFTAFTMVTQFCWLFLAVFVASKRPHSQIQ
jgi:hypothetical protein